MTPGSSVGFTPAASMRLLKTYSMETSADWGPVEAFAAFKTLASLQKMQGQVVLVQQ